MELLEKRSQRIDKLSYFDSAGSTLVFSVDDVFSYRVVDRRGTLDGPTVRFPFDGSNFDVALLLGFTGLAKAVKIKREKISKEHPK